LEPSEEWGWEGITSQFDSAFLEITAAAGLALQSPFLMFCLEVFLYEEEKKKGLLST
jgi:hypothetical protein